MVLNKEEKKKELEEPEELQEVFKEEFNTNDKNEKTCIPFWGENPNVLLNTEHMLEFFPTEDMTYNQKLNAISRSVIILTIIGYVYSNSVRILIVSVLSLLAIYVLHHYHKKGKSKENFENPALEILESSTFDRGLVFDTPTPLNPLSNVMLPDYDYNPEKKPAPPSFGEKTQNAILENAKQLVMDANPGQPDIADKLFRSLGDQLMFEQSMQPFVSNPATTIPNDQEAFAEFCYGSMISCKEGNKFACARNLERHTN